MTKKLTMSILLGILAVVVVFSGLHRVHAQSPVPPNAQQTATMANAAAKVANANAAVATQVTATMTPAASNYVYITGIDLEVCQDATGLAQTNVTWTTTGITGMGATAPIWNYSTALAADVCIYKVISYPTPLKSTTLGAAVTIVSPPSDAHAAYTINAFWYEAP